MINKIIAIVAAGMIFFGISIIYSNRDVFAVDDNTFIVYKSPNCGCCVQHIAYLRENDFKEEVRTTEDMHSIKQKYNIPRDMESCHTAVIGDYFVEGHVPVEAINILLEDRPNLDGIALPEMPSGSPGMPGPKLEPFTIYGLKDGEESLFVKL